MDLHGQTQYGRFVILTIPLPTDFNAELPRVLELGFDDAFIRLWNLYFCYCEAGFFAQVLNLQ